MRPRGGSAIMDDAMAFLRAVLGNLDAVVWAVDKEGIFTLSEGRTLRNLGLEPGQVVGLSAFDVYRENPDLCESVRHALSGEAFTQIVPVGELFFESRYAPHKNAGGEVVGVIGISIDVTQQVRTEKELRSKLELIEQQKLAIRSLSMPIIQVWDDVIALPIVGALDGERASQLMDALLRTVTETRARFAILDLTGASTIDTETANHLMNVVHAVRLLGARTMITGIQPDMAQIFTSLGVDLSEVVTLRNLREALRISMLETPSADHHHPWLGQSRSRR